MSGAPGVPGGGALPDYMQQMKQQADATQEPGGGGLEGFTPGPTKFDEGVNTFRIMPGAKAVPMILEAAARGDWAAVKNACALDSPSVSLLLHYPSYSGGASKGISLFSKVVASPQSFFTDIGATLGEDPVYAFLDEQGVRWTKDADLDARGKALRAAMLPKHRRLLQIVNKGLNGQHYEYGKTVVGLYSVFDDDFEQVWQTPCFMHPEQMQLRPMDPYYYGIDFQILRTGKDIKTTYTQLQGLYPAQGQQFAYPVVMDTAGNPDMAEIERLLRSIVAWENVVERVTPEQVQEAIVRCTATIDKKFATGAVAIPGMAGQPAAGAGLPNTAVAPPNQPGVTAPPAAAPGQPPPPPPGPGMPPPANQPPATAPMPPAMGVPVAGGTPPAMTSAPAVPQNVPNASGGTHVPVAPPQSSQIDPAQMNQAMTQLGQPAAQPAAPAAAPPGAPVAAPGQPPPPPAAPGQQPPPPPVGTPGAGAR